jgi:alpha-amylase/alpha-mannosidase (GH57 family)
LTNYVCVHGHFYQPPRENPSLEAIELQDSAYPYHDWNERVTAECYAPNARARLLDGEQRIVELVNNYSRISFNFGPTLLLWMKQKAPEIYDSILDADKQSQERYRGHGSAIAQAYNHMILPLAHPRDRETQVIWGIQDFAARFGRAPEGMWLPETAVDTATLETLAAQGVRFTILAPRQAKRVKPIHDGEWKDVSDSSVDPSRAYQVQLPSGKTISVFFYDGPISQGIAFENLLGDGKRFADRLLGGFSDERKWPQLSHVATDGESYGHHYHYGEMALSYALHSIETSGQAQLTNYGQFLEMFPPDHMAEIVEDSSWSCIHGIERWKSDCGCNSGGHGGWNQGWRAPLRDALDWLRDTVAKPYEDRAKTLLKDPWAARNAYIALVLDRSEESMNGFFAAQATHELNREERVLALKLLELQRHAMLMYTSCGWFFDELSGLETVQVLHYAGRVIHLAREAAGADVEKEFTERLRNAKSNLPEHGDGEHIYKKWVVPAIVTMDKVAGHYAVSSLFETYGDETGIYCYQVKREDYSVESDGRVRLAVGRAHVRSDITTDEATLSFGVLHLGDHNITGGVQEYHEDKLYLELRDKLRAAFDHADTAEVIRILDQQFNESTFSLRSLFKDEQRRIVGLILEDTLNSVSGSVRAVYENQAALMRFLNGLGVPVPPALVSVATIALNSELRQVVESQEMDVEMIKGLLREAEMNHINVDTTTLEFAMRKRLEEQASNFAKNPGDLSEMKRLDVLLDVAAALPTPVILWEVQNLCYAPLTRPEPNGAKPGEHKEPDPAQQEWKSEASALRERLHIQGPH